MDQIKNTPWQYLSSDFGIDMGSVAESTKGIFSYLQSAGIFLGMILSLMAIVSFIGAVTGSSKAKAKEEAIFRVIMTLIIAGAIIILSLIQGLFDHIFGI